MSNGKAMIIHWIVGLVKKDLYKMRQYFPKPYKHFGRSVNIELDLSSHATKTDLKKQQELIHLN